MAAPSRRLAGKKQTPQQVSLTHRTRVLKLPSQSPDIPPLGYTEGQDIARLRCAAKRSVDWNLPGMFPALPALLF